MSEAYRVVVDLGGSEEARSPIIVAHTFADAAAREAFYAVAGNRATLTNNTTFIVTGNQLQLWTGDTSPPAYASTLWTNADFAIKGDPGIPGGAVDPRTLIAPGGSENNIIVLTADGKVKASSASVNPDGSIVTGAPNSIYLAGSHRISSGVNNIVITNLGLDQHFNPIVVQDTTDQPATPRFPFFTDPGLADFTLGGASGTVSDPLFTYIPSVNRRFYSLTFHAAGTCADVWVDVILNGVKMWDMSIGDIAAGDEKLVDLYAMHQPIDMKANNAYSFKLWSDRGTVVLIGDTVTQTPLIDCKIRSFDWQVPETDRTRLTSVDVRADGTADLVFADGRRVLFDASAWFGGVAPPQPHRMWYGFTVNRPPTEADIKTGASLQASGNTTLALSRVASTQNYMYVWVADTFGTINGFLFGAAFLDTWQSYPVAVDGAAGKVYVSDHTTAATSVTFEVKV